MYCQTMQNVWYIQLMILSAVVMVNCQTMQNVWYIQLLSA